MENRIECTLLKGGGCAVKYSRNAALAAPPAGKKFESLREGRKEGGRVKKGDLPSLKTFLLARPKLLTDRASLLKSYRISINGPRV